MLNELRDGNDFDFENGIKIIDMKIVIFDNNSFRFELFRFKIILL